MDIEYIMAEVEYTVDILEDLGLLAIAEVQIKYFLLGDLPLAKVRQLNLIFLVITIFTATILIYMFILQQGWLEIDPSLVPRSHLIDVLYRDEISLPRHIQLFPITPIRLKAQ